MRRTLLLIPLLVLLAGCARPTTPQDNPVPVAEPVVDCLTVTAGSIDAIRVGVKAIQQSNDVGEAVALRISGGWFVAAEVTGPGLTDTVGVWWTQNDPTTSETNAYNSVDGVAHQFSDYVPSPAYDVTSGGVDEVRTCL